MATPYLDFHMEEDMEMELMVLLHSAAHLGTNSSILAYLLPFLPLLAYPLLVHNLVLLPAFVLLRGLDNLE